MSMEFWETVGQVTLCVLIAVIAACVAVAIAMLMGLLAAIVKNKLDEREDKKMKEKKSGEPVLESMNRMRKKALKDDGKITEDDFADICQEAVEKFGEPLLTETITSLDLPFVAAALQFWAGKTKQMLDVVDEPEAAKRWYHRALNEMEENIETAATMFPSKIEE